MPSAYCGECGWQYRAEGDDASELSRAMIDHFVETGHSPVERCDAEDRLEKRDADRASDQASDRTPESASKPESNPHLE